MTKTPAIEVFEKTVSAERSKLSLPSDIDGQRSAVKSRPSFWTCEALKALLAQTDNKALIILSKLQHLGPVIVAFDVTNASEKGHIPLSV